MCCIWRKQAQLEGLTCQSVVIQQRIIASSPHSGIKLSPRDTLFNSFAVICFSCCVSGLLFSQLWFSLIRFGLLLSFWENGEGDLINIFTLSYKSLKTSCVSSGGEAGRKGSLGMKSSERWRVCEQGSVWEKRRGILNVMCLADSNLLSACPRLILPACSCSLLCCLCQLSLQRHACIKSSKDTPFCQRKMVQVHTLTHTD